MTWEQAQRLVKRGHQVTVVTSRLSGDPAVSSENGLVIHRIAALNTLERIGIPYPVFSPQLFAVLSRLVREHDAVLIYNHSYLSSVVGTIAARMRRRPIVLFQASPYIGYRFPWNAVEQVVDNTVGRFTLGMADKVVAISEHTATHVRKLLPRGGVEVRYLGADTQRFAPVASVVDQMEIRSRLGLPCEAFIVSTVRRFVPRNGLDTLVAAAIHLQREHSDIFVVIVGTGPQKEAVQRIIDGHRLHNVRLAGFVPGSQLPDYYRASDAFVLPTRSGEGFGLVVLEAFASGIPVVATRSGAPEEIVSHGRTGFLIPPGSPRAMADAILTLRRRPDLLADMKQAARAKAVAMDWELCVDGMEEVLVQVMNGKGGMPSMAGQVQVRSTK
jgi:glycosyltransferase involved in cell wall biosynthesis